jgi:hypothetical protein
MTLARSAVVVPALAALLVAAMFIAARGNPASARAHGLWLTQAPQGEDEIGANRSPDGAADLRVGATDDVAAENRLSSVRVVQQNTNDDEEEYVRFCFRDDVQTLDEGKASSFAVVGPDPAQALTATDVTLDRAHANCVVAGFTSGTDVRSFTLGAVEGGVVENRDREQNLADSAALSGARSATRSRTVGPDLTGVRVSKTLNRVEFHFDEALDEGAGADAGAFGFSPYTGDARAASTVVSVDGEVVTVQFDDHDSVDVARRWLVASGAVRDSGGSENPVGAIGGPTAKPDLTTVRRAPADTEYNYTFDDNISGGVDASDFVLYTDDGKAIEGESAVGDGRTVHVTYPRAIEDYNSGAIALAAVDPDAHAATRRESGETIPLGVVALGSTETRPGRTTGPDLVSVSTDPGDRLMILTFDERLDDDDHRDDGSGIFIATDDHRLVKAGRILEIEGAKVYVQAGEILLRSLVGVTLAPGAIHDAEGNVNPIGTVAHGSAGTSSTTSALYVNVPGT